MSVKKEIQQSKIRRIARFDDFPTVEGVVVRSAEERLNFKKDLEARTKAFAVAVFRCLDALPKCNSTRIIAYQLGKSASSVGANYREANRGESPEDFAHKIGIVLKECAESQYWLEVLYDLRPTSQIVRSRLEECTELLRLFQTIDRKMYLRRKKQLT